VLSSFVLHFSFLQFASVANIVKEELSKIEPIGVVRLRGLDKVKGKRRKDKGRQRQKAKKNKR
jgi:hypothetical protein